MFSPKSRAVVVVLLSVLLGAILGIAVDRALGRGGIRPPDPRKAGEHFARMLDRRLDLTAEQKKQIETILQRHGEENEAIFRETRPRIHARMEQTDREIEAVLTPEQREKFRKLVSERKERRPPPPR